MKPRTAHAWLLLMKPPRNRHERRFERALRRRARKILIHAGLGGEVPERTNRKRPQ